MGNTIDSGLNSVQYNPGQKRSSGVGEEEEEKEKKSRWPNEDAAEISEKARALAEERQKLLYPEKAEETDETGDPEAGQSWTTLEAIPDPDDPENRGKAAIRVVAQGDGRNPGRNG